MPEFALINRCLKIQTAMFYPKPNHFDYLIFTGIPLTCNETSVAAAANF
mgnify:CR=1 FL=1|jgi:hypothetical protein